MPYQKLQLLLDAIEREKYAPSQRHKLFMALLAEMYAYEHGIGEAPSVDKFMLWIAAVDKRSTEPGHPSQ